MQQQYVITRQGSSRWLVTFPGYRTRLNVEGPRSQAVEAAHDFLEASQAQLSQLQAVNQALNSVFPL